VVDIDGDGDFEPLTDGLLTMRWCFEFTDDVLIQGAVDSGCTNCTADEITAQLQSLGYVLDVDEDGEVSALTDSVLLMRWGFGFRGQTLVEGAVDLMNCNRCAVGDIEAYLDGLDGG
jgi:hypothetical protein